MAGGEGRARGRKPAGPAGFSSLSCRVGGRRPQNGPRQSLIPYQPLNKPNGILFPGIPFFVVPKLGSSAAWKNTGPSSPHGGAFFSISRGRGAGLGSPRFLSPPNPRRGGCPLRQTTIQKVQLPRNP